MLTDVANGSHFSSHDRVAARGYNCFAVLVSRSGNNKIYNSFICKWQVCLDLFKRACVRPCVCVEAQNFRMVIILYLCVGSLLIDAGRDWGYFTSNYWVKVDNELERLRKEAVVAYFKEMPQCSLRRIEETRPFSQWSECKVSPMYK